MALTSAAPEPQGSPGLSSSAHAAVSRTAGTEAESTSEPGFASANQERAFLPAARHVEVLRVTLSCVSLPAVAYHAVLIWLASYTGQQEKPIPVLLLLLSASFSSGPFD